MKAKAFGVLVLALFLVLTTTVGCIEDSDTGSGTDGDDDIIDAVSGTDGDDDIIDAVFLAQTHVQQPTQDYFYLVGNRETLIKAHVISPTNMKSTEVEAILTLNNRTHNIELNGPSTLPTSIAKTPGVVQHSFDDSFTGYIPKKWVKPGLTIALESGNDRVEIKNLEIGAPTKYVINMFDIQYFNDTNDDYPAGWEEELESKLPIAELDIRRVPHVVFKEVVIPPRPGDGITAIRTSSEDDYKEQTGTRLPSINKLSSAMKFIAALGKAAGTEKRISHYYASIYGTSINGGVSNNNFKSTGNGKMVGVLLHEIGHGLSLPHWGNDSSYPYKGDMLGIEAPESGTETHAGPTWAFDLANRNFIPPTVQEDSVGGIPGTYKQDPMQGGGMGDQEIGYLMRHFSDYSLYQIKNHLENNFVVWNNSLGSYATWDKNTADYTLEVSNNGVEYPVVRDVQVISLMASVCGAKEDANLVYPPIGPYTSGMIDLFDPTEMVDRFTAESVFCPPGGCDVSFRVTQGGVQKIYMLPISWDPSEDPTSKNSLDTRAINLRASNGEVTRVDLLLTLDAEVNGISGTPRVLDSWSNSGGGYVVAGVTGDPEW